MNESSLFMNFSSRPLNFTSLIFSAYTVCSLQISLPASINRLNESFESFLRPSSTLFSKRQLSKYKLYLQNDTGHK